MSGIIGTSHSKSKIVGSSKDTAKAWCNFNGNVSQNRNYGALKAKGNYIAFLDDDDLWNKDYLRYIEKRLNENQSKLIITWLNKIIAFEG